MNIAEFRFRFLEFRTAPDSLINSVLAEAETRVDECVFGKLTSQARGYLAAHLIAISPFGKNLRLEDDGGSTQYETAYLAIRDQCVVRMIVT